jgi:uncharacterized protein YutE (UPF0331/DUF86 family)
MDKIVLAQKLESLRRCLQRIEQKRPATIAALENDADLQDVIVLNLTRAVQLSVDIASHIVSQSNEPPPATMGESFSALEKMQIIEKKTADAMRRSVGFRNIAVHNYEAINWEIVFNICHRQLDDFRQFARAVVNHAGL